MIVSARFTALIALSATAVLAACERKAEEPPAPPVNVAPGPAASPPAPVDLSYQAATPYASMKLTLPEAVKGQPELHNRLYAADVAQLKGFAEGAQADRTEAGTDSSMPPYEMVVTYEPPVETGRIFSLARSVYDFSGGAHGNTLFNGVLWDKAMKRDIPAASIFRPGADLAALDRALCEASNTARKARGIQTADLVLPPKGAPDGPEWTCVRAGRTPFVLAPSTTSGKAGGLTFLIGAYQLGPYAEGPYEVTVPQARIRSLLAPAYADEFAGQPAKGAN